MKLDRMKWIEDWYGSNGYLVSESEGKRGPISRDLFGIFDAVAVQPGTETVGIQFTGLSDVSKRVKKILSKEVDQRLLNRIITVRVGPFILNSGWKIHVWGIGYRKVKGGAKFDTIFKEITLEDFE